MSEHKQPGKSIPLRLRFRSPAEQAQWDREYRGNAGANARANLHAQAPSTGSRQTLQVKELLSLGQLLRTELPLPDILQHIATSISTYTGFRAIALWLEAEQAGTYAPTVFVGIGEDSQQTLRDNPATAEQLQRAMRPEFRMSQSYFVPHEYVVSDLADIGRVVTSAAIGEEPGSWDAEDMLIVPLFSVRQQHMTGFISLDDPQDGRIPTLEQVENIELFAYYAAIAIDKVQGLQQRETERATLEQAIGQLRQGLKRVRRGDLRGLVPALHPKLQPLVDELNAIFEEGRAVVGQIQMVTEAVDEHMQHMQRASEFLLRDTGRQERQMQQISQVISAMVGTMQQIAGRAADLSQMAVEAMEVTMDGQGAVDRAVDGMGKVREATLRASRTMKRLSESGQEMNEALLAMSDLTTRMHLLSLNAAIEASRAAEHGQGFTAIAHELRALAAFSSESSHKTESYIRMTQQETTAVAQSVEQNTQQVVVQTELVTQTGLALEAINMVTDRMARLVQDICNEAEEQARGSQLVVGSVGEVLHMTEGIEQHMHEMQHSLSHLVELTNGLRSRIAHTTPSEANA
jgi:methyl-accepting chemotaxis protein